MFCTSCGTAVVEGNAHCTNCGARVDGVGIVAHAARSAYAGMDESFKRSLMLGGGSMVCTLLTILLAYSAPLLVIILIPAAMALGIMALNTGRDLANRTGYYLGMTGYVVATTMLFVLISAYAARTAAMSMAASAGMGMMGRMF